ncbi:nuclear transport factor 2 family protein [Oculatella sp. FACHB-28]|uniref:nuclear transport factor 2 family protein n=1 Tax=Oculatella sp. FACHB-28 TaxID=2692845 RepID=UPI0018EF9BEC|nr:nuclear transport factor 2 family protein [Oculatella sp. FACHB-28]
MPHASTKRSTFAKPQPIQSRLLNWIQATGRAWLVPSIVGLAIAWGGDISARAESPATAPPELRETLTQIDAAASQGDVEAVMEFYSSEFTHADGLTYETMQQALTAFWERYPDLTYQTALTSWEPDGDAIVAETVTTITGTQEAEGRTFKLDSTIASRQRFVGRQMVSQEILTERSQVTSGENPPTVTVSLPEQVTTEQEYPFDAIVTEPLGDRVLLGTALEEPVRPEGYLNPITLDLTLLPAGGLFKVGQAPATPESRWVSAIIIREDGITEVTQRLRVVGQ